MDRIITHRNPEQGDFLRVEAEDILETAGHRTWAKKISIKSATTTLENTFSI